MRRHVTWFRTVAVTVAAILAGAALVVMQTPKMTVVAHFPSVKGLYVGDDVTVIGVPVGKITAIDSRRGDVRVEMEVSSDEPLAADVKAAQVATSLISVRAITLGPRYTGGPRLRDGDVIPQSRTAVPVEWDEIKNQLIRLSEALGPNGSNQNGALSDLVGTSATFLDGQGDDIRTTITQVSEALSTLSDNRGELFATVRNLQVFVTALNSSDRQVRSFNTRLADVSGVLAEDRTQLAAALARLRSAFVDVRKFLKSNKDVTASTLQTLRSTTSVLGENPQPLADLLQVAPGALSNLYGILDPRVPGPTGILTLSNLSDPANFVCSGLYSVGGTEEMCRQALGPILKYFKVNAPPVGLRPPRTAGQAVAWSSPARLEQDRAPTPTHKLTVQTS